MIPDEKDVKRRTIAIATSEDVRVIFEKEEMWNIKRREKEWE
jgi:hypothetical protein